MKSAKNSSCTPAGAEVEAVEAATNGQIRECPVALNATIVAAWVTLRPNAAHSPLLIRRHNRRNSAPVDLPVLDVVGITTELNTV
jgi:hypothetical protein